MKRFLVHLTNMPDDMTEEWLEADVHDMLYRVFGGADFLNEVGIKCVQMQEQAKFNLLQEEWWRRFFG